MAQWQKFCIMHTNLCHCCHSQLQPKFHQNDTFLQHWTEVSALCQPNGWWKHIMKWIAACKATWHSGKNFASHAQICVVAFIHNSNQNLLQWMWDLAQEAQLHCRIAQNQNSDWQPIKPFLIWQSHCKLGAPKWKISNSQINSCNPNFPKVVSLNTSVWQCQKWENIFEITSIGKICHCCDS